MRKRGARQYLTGYTEGQMDEALAKVRLGIHDRAKGIYF